jgi:hypothetical protein
MDHEESMLIESGVMATAGGIVFTAPLTDGSKLSMRAAENCFGGFTQHPA